MGLLRSIQTKISQIPESGILFIANLNEVDLEELVALIPDDDSEISDKEISKSKSIDYRSSI